MREQELGKRKEDALCHSGSPFHRLLFFDRKWALKIRVKTAIILVASKEETKYGF